MQTNEQVAADEPDEIDLMIEDCLNRLIAAGAAGAAIFAVTGDPHSARRTKPTAKFSIATNPEKSLPSVVLLMLLMSTVPDAIKLANEAATPTAPRMN